MKQLFTAVFFLIAIQFTCKAGPAYAGFEYERVMAIDSTDTVYFDLSKAVISGNQLILPVGIMTSQPVNSLDFSLKYDHVELDYDTMFNLTTYLQGLSYYNPTDSTVRYTSSSFQAISVGVNLVNVQFNLLGSQINNADFSEVKGYLNGVKCTAVIMNQLSVGVAVHVKEHSLQLFPNPAKDQLSIASNQDIDLIITDMQGRKAAESMHISAGEELNIPVENLNNGMYLIQSTGAKKFSTRFIVQH